MKEKYAREGTTEINNEDEGIIHSHFCDGVNKIRQDVWHGMTTDGSVVALEEEVVRKQFGDMFVDDCKLWAAK